jgi:hypothetical protein
MTTPVAKKSLHCMICGHICVWPDVGRRAEWRVLRVDLECCRCSAKHGGPNDPKEWCETCRKRRDVNDEGRGD